MTISRTLLFVFLVNFATASPSQSRAEDAPKLTKDAGPFLVLAYVFRGDDAETHANELANALKKDINIPSFTYENPEKPDEFQVYVGDCKTTRESFDLMRRVKKIHPRSIPDSTNPARKGRGLSRAITRKNPLAEAR